MSLIQEALRRRAEESGGIVPPPMPLPAVTEPVRGEARAQRRGGPPKGAVAAVAATVLAILVGAALLAARAVGAWGGASRAEAAVADPDAHVAAPAASGTVPEPTAAERAAAQPEATPLPPALVAGGATLATNVEQQRTAAAPAVEAVASVAAGAAAVESPVAAAAEWPAVRVNGVMLSQKTEKSAAIINDRVVNLRGSVGGARLIEVSDAGVVLELEGRTRFYEIGAEGI